MAIEESKKYAVYLKISSVGAFEFHHLQRKNIALAVEVPRQLANRVESGVAYRVDVDSVVEEPRLKAVKSRDGVSLRVSWTDASEFGIGRETRISQNRVVEFQLQNVSKSDEQVRRYFTQHQGKSSFQFLVSKNGSREGDIFRLVSVRKYEISDFVHDFNLHKSPRVQNLNLVTRGQRLSMEVDAQTLAFQQWRLGALGSKVVLSATPKHVSREMRFWFDGEHTEIRFAKYCLLNWARGTSYGIEISYSPNSHRECRFRQSLGRFDGSIIKNGVALISKPKHDGDPFVFSVAPSAQEYVRFRLGSTEKYRGYMSEKGRISEEIQTRLIWLTGQWDEVASHPSRYGPDSLQRLKASKELYYFELKWEQSKPIIRTRVEATRQATRDYHGRPFHERKPVAGAYIGLLEWNGDGFGRFFLEKVWPASQPAK